MRLVTWALCLISLVIVGWALLTAGPAVVHGHPGYAVMLLLTGGGAVVAAWRNRRPRPRSGWRLAWSLGLSVLAVGWLGATWWSRPFNAVEPALAALESDARVRIEQSATRIVMTPVDPAAEAAQVGVFFQPGAKVEARAYAATLRPLAEAGHPVVIVKQPLGIAFLAIGAFNSTRSAMPQVQSWVLGGHSLGGTVAAMQATGNPTAGVGGLLLWASYPASNIRDSLAAPALSIYGTRDGIATPAEIAASQEDLPVGAKFLGIEGAIHSFFADYGLQPGDGQPTVSREQARAEIAAASVDFVGSVRQVQPAG